MINYTQRESDIMVKWKKSPLGTIERKEGFWAYIPRATDRAIRWEFNSLQEVKRFIEGKSLITLNKP